MVHLAPTRVLSAHELASIKPMIESDDQMVQVMPDLDETNRAQEDLLELCKDRPQPTDGPFPENSFYGIDGILRRYAGLARSFPIAAVIPHSVMLDPSFVWGREIDARVPAILSFPEYRDEAYEALTSKRVIPSASPYLYLVRMLGAVPASERQGTIFFPVHSTHHVTTATEPESTAAALTEVEERFKPVTVCVYWRDIQLGRHVAYLEEGLRVVSAGHIFDNGFLYRLHWLCSQHRYASGNSLGSHTFFSVESGCTFVGFFDEEPDLHALRSQEPFGARVATNAGRSVISEAGEVFTANEPDVMEQKRLVDYFLRRERALPPEELAAQLEELRLQDLWGYRTGSGFPWMPPGWVMRSPPARGLRYLAKPLLKRSSL